MKHSQPNITPMEAQAAFDAVLTGNLATGKICEQFEDKFKELFGYKYVLAVNSGTSALMLALLAAGIGPGDEVIVSPYTMVASVNVVLNVGATPVFADIDPYTYCITPETVASALTEKTRAVIPVDIFGVPADVKGIKDILPSHVCIIEDTIEALGSTVKGIAVGHEALAGAYGFFPNKQITTGIGGVLFTNDEHIYTEARALSRHGVKTTVSGGDMYSQGYGFNLRMSDVQAAIGLVQLERFDEIQAAMIDVRTRLDQYFRPWRKQRYAPGDYCNDFVYVIQVEGLDKDKYIKKMAEQGVPVKQYFIPLHKLPHLQGFVRGPLPVAEKVGAETVALPHHFELTDAEMIDIFAAHRTALIEQGIW